MRLIDVIPEEVATDVRALPRSPNGDYLVGNLHCCVVGAILLTTHLQRRHSVPYSSPAYHMAPTFLARALGIQIREVMFATKLARQFDLADVDKRTSTDWLAVDVP